jgi:hypothetical protein
VVVEMSQFQLNHMNHRLLKCAKDILRYPSGRALASFEQSIAAERETYNILSQLRV